MDLAQDFRLPARLLKRHRRGGGTLPALSPGSLGRPTLASAEKGERIYKMMYERIATRVLGVAAS
jgi:creatinine amidohydrolase/Fe(II)-dependent formamide hydrolase-like protein